MSELTAKKGLTHFQIIILFAFISLMVELYRFSMNVITYTTGIGEIRFIRLYLQVLPGVYIIHRNFRKASLKTPFLIPFLLMILTFILLESDFSYYSSTAPHDYEFIWRQINIYVFFLMLVNFGLDRTTFYRVIGIAFYCSLAIVLVTYGGYLGLYEMGFQYGFTSLLFFERPSTTMDAFSATNVSHVSAFGIFLLLIRRYKNKAHYKNNIIRDSFFSLLFLSMIMINATRGAFLIILMLVTYYIWRLSKNIKRKKKIHIITVVIGSIIILLSITNVFGRLGQLSEKLILFNRIINYESYTSTRIENMQNAWENFLNHPITGVGYYHAAKMETYNLGTRSNNQFVQLLASSGIVFFMIYIYYLYKFYIFKWSLLKEPEVVLSVIFILFSSLSARPSHMFAVFGYIAYYFYVQNRREKNLISHKI